MSLIFIKLSFGLLIPIFLLICYYLQCLTCTIILSETLYFERQAIFHVQQMTYSLGRAAFFHSSSKTHQQSASEYRVKSSKDAEIGQSSLQKSIYMKEKSEKDASQAIIDEETRKAWGEKSASDGEQAALHISKAEEEEAAYDTLITEGEAESAIVARDEGLALEDVEAIALCEFIPFLDLLCDGIGGATEIGLHTKAAEETAQAGEDFAAAASIRSEEELEEKIAAESEAARVQDEEMIKIYESKTKEDMDESRLEQTASEELKEESEIEIAKSKEENEMSLIEESKAGEEEVTRRAAMETAMAHGLNGLLCIGILLISSFFVLFYFTLKLFVYLLVPTFDHFHRYILQSFVSQESESDSLTIIVPNKAICFWVFEITSFLVIHFLIFLGVLFLFANDFNAFLTTSVKEKGEIVILFALNAALIQCIIVQLIHRFIFAMHLFCFVNNINKRDWLGVTTHLSRHFLRHLFFFFPLFIIEIIFFWVCLSSDIGPIFKTNIVWSIWMILLCYVFIHIRLFDTYGLTATIKEEQKSSSISTQILDKSNSNMKYICLNTLESNTIREIETSSLLLSDQLLYPKLSYGTMTPPETANETAHETAHEAANQGMAEYKPSYPKPSVYKLNYEFDLDFLRYPLEILTVVCMVKLVITSCLPGLIVLRPVYIEFFTLGQEYCGGYSTLYVILGLLMCLIVGLPLFVFRLTLNRS